MNEEKVQINRPLFRFRFFLFFIPGAMILFFLSLSFGCGLGGGSDFYCRVAAPSLPFAIIISIVTLVLIFKTPWPEKIRTGVKILFALSFLIPLVLFLLPGFLSKEAGRKYLEGLTPEACSTQKTSVPWGKRYINADSCYFEFNMCDKVEDAYLEGLCYSRTKTFDSYNSCSVFKDWFNKYSCEVGVAKKLNDLNFCSTVIIPTSPGTNDYTTDVIGTASSKIDCASDVEGYKEEIYLLIMKYDNNNWRYTPFAQEARYCDNLSPVFKKDLCYAQSAKREHRSELCSKISNELPWLKNICLVASSRR